MQYERVYATIFLPVSEIANAYVIDAIGCLRVAHITASLTVGRILTYGHAHWIKKKKPLSRGPRLPSCPSLSQDPHRLPRIQRKVYQLAYQGSPETCSCPSMVGEKIF